MKIKMSLDSITLKVAVVSAVALLIQVPISVQSQAALRQVGLNKQAVNQERRLEAQERKQAQQQQRAAAYREKVAQRRAVMQPAVTASPALEQVYSQALTALEAARNDLLNGNHDYHGYRAEALARANDTIGQIKEALKYYQAGAKGVGVNAAAVNATRLNEAFARSSSSGPSSIGSRSVEASSLPGGVAVKRVSEAKGEAVQGRSPVEPTSRSVGSGKGVFEIDDPARDHFMPDALTALRQAQATLQGAGADTRGIHARAVQQLNDASEMVIRGIEWQQIHRKLTTVSEKKRP